MDSKSRASLTSIERLFDGLETSLTTSELIQKMVTGRMLHKERSEPLPLLLYCYLKALTMLFYNSNRTDIFPIPMTSMDAIPCFWQNAGKEIHIPDFIRITFHLRNWCPCLNGVLITLTARIPCSTDMYPGLTRGCRVTYGSNLTIPHI